ncbi:MAG: hypothetical protein PGN12_06165 [Sphingomonas phyllosphaerae]
MQHVSRPKEAPGILNSAEAKRSRQLMLDFMSLEKGRRSQTSVAHFGIDAAEPALVQALAAFTNGRCAFCESVVDLSAHRFRPAGNALPAASRKDAHLFYVWLADAWQNPLPICDECRPAEPLFPVEGSRCSLPSPQQVRSYVERGSGLWPNYPPNERNMLIDPSRETGYDRHFTPKLDGTLVSLSPRAAITFETFRLNRDVLARRRAAVFEDRLQDLRKLLSSGAGRGERGQRSCTRRRPPTFLMCDGRFLLGYVLTGSRYQD